MSCGRRRAVARLAVLALALGGCAKKERHVDQERWREPVVRSAPRTIVVLGSSTAAGVGPRDPEDAYIPRYAAILARTFPDFTLVNLAVPGQTTYHIQPTGFVPPPGRPSPAPGHNVSTALSHRPAAILVNLPSNDTAADIAPAEQLENFARVAKLAAAAKVPLWMSSPQPRHFEPEKIAAQREVRTALSRDYAPRSLDFWAPLAARDGRLKPELDAGDGTHLNAAGHTILLELVLAARIPHVALQSAD